MHNRQLVALLACGILISPQPGSAQFGGVTYCTNCSTSWTQLIMEARQLLQYQQELQTALNAVKLAQQAIREGQDLATHPLTNITGDLGLLSTILIQSQGLAGSMAQMDQTFRNIYVPYAATSSVPYATVYNGWASTTLNTILGTLRAAGMQGSMLQNEQAWISQVQSMMQSPLGRNEALQLGNAIGTEEVAQLQKLRQLMIADLQSKAAYTSYQLTQDQTNQSNVAAALQQVDRDADHRQYGNVPQP